MSVEVGQAFDVVATVTDAGGVEEVSLHYKVPGALAFTTIEMPPSQDGPPGEADVYVATVPALKTTGTLEYYVEATDGSGNAARLPLSGEISVEVVEPASLDAGRILSFVVPPLAVIGAVGVFLVLRRRRPPTREAEA